MKRCSKCKIEKSFNEFHKDKRAKDNYKSWCKQCNNEASKNRKKKKTLFTCEACNITKEVDFYTNKRRTTNFCLNCLSREKFAGIKRPNNSGKNSARWKGGEYISTDGYKMIKCEDKFHPSGRVKYKKEHILVIENHIGRELLTQRGYMGEQVHHIDGDKLNNCINNLCLCKDTREHKLIDCQLHEVAFELVRNKIIEFDNDQRKYFINWEKIKCQQDQTQLN